MDRITRVSIVGMGALGVLYGDFFARTLGLEQVTFLADRGPGGTLPGYHGIL